MKNEESMNVQHFEFRWKFDFIHTSAGVVQEIFAVPQKCLYKAHRHRGVDLEQLGLLFFTFIVLCRRK